MLTLEVSLNKGGSMIAVSSLSSSLFPIYGVASAEVPFSAAVAEGRELRSLLQSFGIKRKEAARTLGTTRGEIFIVVDQSICQGRWQGILFPRYDPFFDFWGILQVILVRDRLSTGF